MMRWSSVALAFTLTVGATMVPTVAAAFQLVPTYITLQSGYDYIFGPWTAKSPSPTNCLAPWNEDSTGMETFFQLSFAIRDRNSASDMLGAVAICKQFIFTQNLATFNAQNFSTFWPRRDEQGLMSEEERVWYDQLGGVFIESSLRRNITLTYPQCFSGATKAPIAFTAEPAGPPPPGGPSGGTLSQIPSASVFQSLDQGLKDSLFLQVPMPAAPTCPTNIFGSANAYGQYLATNTPVFSSSPAPRAATMQAAALQMIAAYPTQLGSFDLVGFMTAYSNPNQLAGSDFPYLTDVSNAVLEWSFLKNLTLRYPTCFGSGPTSPPTFKPPEYRQDPRLTSIYRNLTSYKPASPVPAGCPNFTATRLQREATYKTTTANNVVNAYKTTFNGYFAPTGFDAQMYLSTLEILSMGTMTVDEMAAVVFNDTHGGPPGGGPMDGSMGSFSFPSGSMSMPSGSGSFDFPPPNGTFPGGPNGTFPNGTFPNNGSFPNGSFPGPFPNMTAPNGSTPESQLDREVQMDIIMMAQSLVYIVPVEADMRCRPTTLPGPTTTRLTTTTIPRGSSTQATTAGGGRTTTAVTATQAPVVSTSTTTPPSPTSTATTRLPTSGPTASSTSSAATATTAPSTSPAVTSPAGSTSTVIANPTTSGPVTRASTTTANGAGTTTTGPTSSQQATTTGRGGSTASASVAPTVTTTRAAVSNGTTTSTAAPSTSSTAAADTSSPASTSAVPATTAAPAPLKFTATVSTTAFNEAEFKSQLARQLGIDPALINITVSSDPSNTAAPSPPAPLGVNGSSGLANVTRTPSTAGSNATITISFIGAAAGTISNQMALLTQNATAMASLGITDVRSAPMDGATTAAPSSSDSSSLSMPAIIGGAIGGAVLLVVLGVVIAVNAKRGRTVSSESHLSEWERELNSA